MNKATRFLYGCFLFTITIAILGALVFFVIEDNKKNQYVCIEDYMYMRVEGSLLIYPSPSEPMRCEVFEYIDANKKESIK